MNRQRFTLPAAAYLILIKQDKILLAQRKGGWAAGMYSLVAGHIDGSETMKQAIVREAKEEIGIDIQPDQLSITCVMHRYSDDTEYFDVFLKADTWEGEPSNCEPDKIEKLDFFPMDQLPESLLDHVKTALSAMGQGVSYIDFGWKDS
jgi:8-oxo-dGTP diphosphatase